MRELQPRTPRRHLDLIGTVPRPSGGVAQHVWRLAMRMAPFGCRVLDIHPAESKYPMPNVDHACSPWLGLAKAAWLYGKLLSSAARVAHFHFSSTRAFGLGRCWIPRNRRSQVRILTLHHGNLHDLHRRLNNCTRRIAAASIRRFDRIIALSDLQHEFYTNMLQVPVDRLVRAGSFLSLPPSALDRCTTLGAVIPHGNRQDVSLVASGYVVPYYRHEESIRLVDRLRERCDARLTLCLYGPREDHEYLKLIQTLAAARPHVSLRFDLDLPEFLPILAEADVYLRPNTVDSYGIAVGDAISLGVPVVASDVCDRYPGTTLFPVGDYDAFEHAVEQVVGNLARYRQAIAGIPATDSFNAYLHAYDLPCLQTPALFDYKLVA